MKTLKYGYLYPLLAILTILFSSCKKTSDNNVTTNNPLEENKSIVECKMDTAVKYTIYIPLGNSKDKLPVLLFFDPHAQGQLPVENYTSLADKYGFILIGSLNSKNGMDYKVTQHIINVLLKDIYSNNLIDKKRIYLSGFSGGAKLAMAYGMQIPEIAGVVACGGSINPGDFFRPGFSIIGMVGNKDFNYLDMMHTLAAFNKNNQSYSTVVFDGAHEWPPVGAYNKAFVALETDAIKHKLKDKDKTWLREVRAQSLLEYDSLIKNDQKLEALDVLNISIKCLNSLIDVSDLESHLAQMHNDPALKKVLQKKSQMMQNEIQLRSQYTQAINDRDLDWWRTQVNEMRRIISEKDAVVGTTVQRVLNYLSMALYVMIDADLKNNKEEDALKKVNLYEMVDPDNPGVYLMYARYYYMTRNTEYMINYFQKATDIGFNAGEYNQDLAWRELFQQPEIARMIK